MFNELIPGRFRVRYQDELQRFECAKRETQSDAEKDIGSIGRIVGASAIAFHAAKSIHVQSAGTYEQWHASRDWLQIFGTSTRSVAVRI